MFTKLKWSSKDRLSGYLTPSEIVCLVEEFKVKPDADYKRSYERCSNGDQYPTWYYFQPNNAVRKQLPKAMQVFKNHG
jgi:hypothetical protein